jgi:hypothetical protein
MLDVVALDGWQKNSFYLQRGRRVAWLNEHFLPLMCVLQ